MQLFEQNQIIICSRTRQRTLEMLDPCTLASHQKRLPFPLFCSFHIYEALFKGTAKESELSTACHKHSLYRAITRHFIYSFYVSQWDVLFLNIRHRSTVYGRLKCESDKWSRKLVSEIKLLLITLKHTWISQTSRSVQKRIWKFHTFLNILQEGRNTIENTKTER